MPQGVSDLAFCTSPAHNNMETFQEVETYKTMTNCAQTPHAQTDFLQLDTLCLQVFADFEAAHEAFGGMSFARDEFCKMHAVHGEKLWPTCNATHDLCNKLVCRTSMPNRLVAAPVQGNNSSSVKL